MTDTEYKETGGYSWKFVFCILIILIERWTQEALNNEGGLSCLQKHMRYGPNTAARCGNAMLNLKSDSSNSLTARQHLPSVCSRQIRPQHSEVISLQLWTVTGHTGVHFRFWALGFLRQNIRTAQRTIQAITDWAQQALA